MSTAVRAALTAAGLVACQPGAAPPAAALTDATPPTAAQLLALTERCEPLAGVGKFRTDAGQPATVPICRLEGALWWRADADIDCDGGSSAACRADPDYQAETSAKDSQGRFIDAATVPFLVVPGGGEGFNPRAHNIKTGWSGYGSAGAIIYDGRVLYAPYADAGPAGVIGELSQAAAVGLGIPDDPRRGGVDGGVTYIVFTGADNRIQPVEDPELARSLGERLAARLLSAN